MADISVQPNPHRIGVVVVHRHATMPDLLTLVIHEDGSESRLVLTERVWRRVAAQLVEVGVIAPAVADQTVIAWGGEGS